MLLVSVLSRRVSVTLGWTVNGQSNRRPSRIIDFAKTFGFSFV